MRVSKMMLLTRSLVSKPRALGMAFSTTNRSTSGTLSVLQQVANNAGENKDRSYWYLFKERSPWTHERVENVKSSNAESAPQTKTDVSKKQNMKVFDMDEAEDLKETNKLASVRFLANEKTQKEEANLRKVVNTLLGELEDSVIENLKASGVEMMNRNARAPKKANHGRRPCSHVSRRSKRMKRHKGW